MSFLSPDQQHKWYNYMYLISKVFCFILVVCVYKGKSYGHGQRWQDGCDYNCVCTDGMTGHYECTERYCCKVKLIYSQTCSCGHLY
jgi:hypothetical protein